MATGFLPFHLPDIGDAEIESVVESLRSGWITTGPKTKEFERRFAEATGSQNAVMLNSCTAALHLALEAIGLQRGDEVVVPTMTFAATAEVVRYFGATPVLVDVKPDDHNIDPGAVERWASHLDSIRKAGSSCGAVIEIVAEGVPAGLGAPLYAKLDQDIASAIMSINAVKGVEIGDGFAAASLTGEENADEMRKAPNGEAIFLSNHAGGILGGISTAQPIVVRFAVKPTSSILSPRRTIDRFGAETEILTKGRHDPCVGIRAVPVGEAMVALVLADHLLLHRAQNPHFSG